MLQKVGLKEKRERKNKSKVTQELVERKVKKLQETQARNEESLTQMKKKRGNSKVKEYGKQGKIK